MSHEIHKLQALRELERWLRNPDLDPRLGLAFACSVVRVDEGEVAVLALVKLIECARARQAVASMNEGDDLAVAAHRAQFPAYKRKGNGAP